MNMCIISAFIINYSKNTIVFRSFIFKGSIKYLENFVHFYTFINTPARATFAGSRVSTLVTN